MHRSKLANWIVLFVVANFAMNEPSQSCAKIQESKSVKRWAVICTPELQSVGLSDLLTAQLSDQNFELVERELLAEAIKELELSSLSGATATTNRLKLGSILNADVLVLVSKTSNSNGETDLLQTIICECEFGARLLVSQSEFAEENRASSVDTLAKRVVVQATETRDRFVDGVKQIVGVAPFQSLNLTHRYDGYQRGFQHILESALLDRPGVVVIEMEEARSIQKERSLAAREKVSRVALNLVSGSFQIEEDSERKQTVAIQIDWVAENGDSKKLSHTGSMDEVGRYLGSKLPNEFVKNTKSAIDVTSQVRWFSEQAEQFHHRGDWDECTGLCEAALLLDPSNATIRRLAVDNYLRACSAPCADSDLFRITVSNDDPRLKNEVAKRESAYLGYIQHLEIMIRNRTLSANEASSLIRLTNGVFGRSTSNGPLGIIRQEKKSARIMEKAEQEFIQRIKPIVLGLDRDFSFQKKFSYSGNYYRQLKTELDLVTLWDGLRFASVRSRLDRNYLSVGDLEQLGQILLEEIPVGRPINHEVTALFQMAWTDPNRKILSGYRDFPDYPVYKDWQAFLQKMLDSGNPNAMILSRHVSLRYDVRFKKLMKPRDWGNEVFDRNLAHHVPINKERDIDAIIQLYEEAEQWNRDYLDLPSDSEEVRSKHRDDKTRKSTDYYQRQLNFAINGEPERTPDTPVVPTVPVAGVVLNMPVEIDLKTLDGQLISPSPPIWNLRTNQKRSEQNTADPDDSHYSGRSMTLTMSRCGSVDIWWHSNRILLMEKKGLLEEIIVDPDAEFHDVIWDGENVWIATRQKGIWILDLKTRKILKICSTEQGLPPANAGIEIIDIEPGKILCIGSFGKNFRAWCATIELKDDLFFVDVFHKAIDPSVNQEDIPDWTDPNICFYPTWIAKYQPRENGPSQFFVGRKTRRFSKNDRPLLVDPHSRSVSADIIHQNLVGYLTGRNVSGSFFSQAGSMYVYSKRGYSEPGPAILKFDPTEKDESDKGEVFSQITLRSMPPSVYRILQIDGKLVTGGTEWFKFDPKTLEQKRYVYKPFNVKTLPSRYNESAHYGIISWQDNSKGLKVRQFELKDNE